MQFSFWANRGDVEAVEPNYLAFRHFDGTHIALLALAGVIIFCAVLVFKRLSTAGRNRFLTVLTVLLLLDELAKYAIAIGTDDWYWGYLPLHLCSINIFVCLAYTLTKKDFFAEILYCLCLPGAAIALLVPTWNDLPVLNGMHLHSASVHIMLGAAFGKRLSPRLPPPAENPRTAGACGGADLLCEPVARYEFFLPCSNRQ